jgi:Phosphoesterase family
MPRIKHFIVLMLENRSFDHLLGFFAPPAGETVEHLQAIFGLNGLLNHRDESARSFADLFDVADQPRSASDMPERLNRAPLEETVESVVAGVPLHPVDEPLDDLTRDWALGMLSLLRGGLESVEEPPAIQGEAAAAIEAKLEAAGL